MNEDSMELKTLLRINNYVKGSMVIFYLMIIIDILFLLFTDANNLFEIRLIFTSFLLGCYLGSYKIRNMILKMGEDYIED